MLLQANDSVVLLIDIQQRLAPAIANSQAVTDAAAWVLELAPQFNIPVLVTEQYPKGLGHTVPDLAALVSPEHIIEKIHFSAFQEVAVSQRLNRLQRHQVVVMGTETHVCVLQTVLDLISANYQVFVVEEAVGSRHFNNKTLALSRMQQAGAQIISKEMLAFEWLHKAGTDLFRHISQGWIR